jgi:hypothetical protein
MVMHPTHLILPAVCLTKVACFSLTLVVADENDLNGPTVSMDDQKVIAKIRRKFLVPPSSRTEPYNLDAAHVYDTSMGQSEMILSILGEQVVCEPLTVKCC